MVLTMTMIKKASDPLEEVNWRIEHWCLWRLSNDYQALGYPSCSAEQVIPISGGRVLPEWKEEIEMEKMICDMPSYIRDPLIVDYLFPGTAESKYKQLNMSEKTYYGRIQMAKYYLLAKIN